MRKLFSIFLILLIASSSLAIASTIVITPLDEKVFDKDIPEYDCGIWYSPYVKVYSIGGKNRILEVSNYPRAYKDTDPHLDKYGNPLPGAFPLWVESESIPFVPKQDHIFPLDKVPGSISELTVVGIELNGEYLKLTESAIDAIKESLSSGEIVFQPKIQDSDKQILRIEYVRSP